MVNGEMSNLKREMINVNVKVRGETREVKRVYRRRKACLAPVQVKHET